MQYPKISVIVPIHNGEKTLTKLLESLTIQKYANCEFLFVDNNSSDNTRNIITEFQKKDARAKYIFEQKISRGAARHTGEMYSQGEIILMTDADCVVPKDWIELMTKPIVNGEYGAVQGFEIEVGDNVWSKCQQKKVEEKWRRYKNTEKIMVDTKNFAILKEKLAQAGFSNPSLQAMIDADLWVRLNKLNVKICATKNSPVVHRHPETIKNVAKKHFDRGYWCAIITKIEEKNIKGTKFKQETCQTFFSFLSFLPGSLISLFKYGPAFAYFNLVSGLFWRLGLIFGWISSLFFDLQSTLLNGR